MDIGQAKTVDLLDCILYGIALDFGKLTIYISVM